MKLTGLERRELGLDQVTEHNPEFVDIVRREAIRHADMHGTVCADEMRSWALQQGIAPKHPNAWGAVFRTGFVRVGYRPSTHPASHGRIISIWRVS